MRKRLLYGSNVVYVKSKSKKGRKQKGNTQITTLNVSMKCIETTAHEKAEPTNTFSSNQEFSA